MKRVFDLLVSTIMLLFLLPALAIIALLIKLDSAGPVFYLQERIGKDRLSFKIIKFRTMHVDADKKGLLTVGGRDPRVTRTGYILRKYKLDELPQLFNVLSGDMSLVGPRPEVKKYVDLYNQEQLKVLQIKPGITDFASIQYSDENELLGKAENPEELYIREIMPEKLRLNRIYMKKMGFATDLQILFSTVKKIFT